MTTLGKILIIEDEEGYSAVEESCLQTAGYSVSISRDFEEALNILEAGETDLVIAVLKRPGDGRYAVCAKIRKKYDRPLLVMAPRAGAIDPVQALSAGADDFLGKPFDPIELIARVRANLREYRRIRGEAAADGGGSEDRHACSREILVGNLRILPDAWRVYRGGEEVVLTNREFELLRFLAENPNVTFSRDQLMEQVWGYESFGDGATVMVHINRLREKLEEDPRKPKILRTIWGSGYCFHTGRPK
jgi:DNA-binding response OmpR family regulator